jgi:hypothetical protein
MKSSTFHICYASARSRPWVQCSHVFPSGSGSVSESVSIGFAKYRTDTSRTVYPRCPSLVSMATMRSRSSIEITIGPTDVFNGCPVNVEFLMPESHLFSFRYRPRPRVNWGNNGKPPIPLSKPDSSCAGPSRRQRCPWCCRPGGSAGCRSIRFYRSSGGRFRWESRHRRSWRCD